MSSFLATDTFTPHDCYLELLQVDQIPTSAYGGRPNIFAVVFLERALSAPQTVLQNNVPDAARIANEHLSSKEIAAAAEAYGRGASELTSLSYNKFTQGSTNAATNHPAAGTDALPASQVMIPSALHHESPSVGSSVAKASSAGLGGSIRVARSNIISNAPLAINLETKFCISHCHDREVIRITVYDHVESARGFLGTATFPVGGPMREYGSRLLRLEGPTAMTLQVAWEIGAATEPLTGHIQQRYSAAITAAHLAPRSVLQSHRATIEERWQSRYGNSVQQVSAATKGESTPTSVVATNLETQETTTIPANGASTGEKEDDHAATIESPQPLLEAGTTISAREAHLEKRVKELEETLLAVTKNIDERAEHELLRRVAGGFAQVQDLTNVAAQGHGTITQALAQMAATQRLAGLSMQGPGSPTTYSSSPTVGRTLDSVAASQAKEHKAKKSYYDSDLMRLPHTNSSSSPNAPNSPSASHPLGDLHTCPNLLDLLNNPSRKLHAEEEAVMMSYLGPHTLYQSDASRSATVHSALLGSHIDLPTLEPHHGSALPASQILGTDVLSAGMQKGLPPLLGTANVTSAMPLSYAKNTMKYHRVPTLEVLASTYVASASTPLSPSKRVVFQQPDLGGLSANNTVLNDIAIASMYPQSKRLLASQDPYFQDNTAAWKTALANRDTHVAIEGSKITPPA